MRRPAPLDDLATIARPTLYLLGVISATKALSLVMLASSLAAGIVSVIGGTSAWVTALGWGLVAGLLRAASVWAHRVVSARSLVGAKEEIRSRLAEQLVSHGTDSVGASSTLLTRGLNDLDKYYTVFLPALVDAACIPLIIGARILFADWLSAVIIVVTVPLIPVFMALIGMHTRERVTAASRALERLADHLVELARGLPVLIGLGRAEEQTDALRTISEDYRSRTVQTLRTAFLSALALELISTVSVALVAVTVGIRLVSGGLGLEVGLLVLLLAPECYAPLREIGTAFHASQDGRDALTRARAVITKNAGVLRRKPLAGAPIAVDRLTVLRFGRAEAAVQNLSFAAPTGRITLLDGRSGSGKSTVLAALAGELDRSTVLGTITGVTHGEVAWLPQHPRTVESTVRGELELYGTGGTDVAAGASATLDSLGLSALATVDPARLSPGELRRLAFGRVIMRVAAGATLVLLDEPTAHLDGASADLVIAQIEALRGAATVIVASHDDAVRALADRVVPIGDGQTVPHARAESTRATATARVESISPPAAHPLRALNDFLRPIRGRMVGAIALGTLSTLFAISLTAVSGWLIVRASEHPAIMYLLVAIVGVRFFGIGRAVLRYSERLVAHDAIFRALTDLRMRLWRGLAAQGVTNRALFSGGVALDRLVRDADLVRDLSLRVVRPPLVAAASGIAVIVALAVLVPASLLITLPLVVLGIVGAAAVSVAVDRHSTRLEQTLRSGVLRRVNGLLESAADLRVNGVDGVALDRMRQLDARAGSAERRAALATGLGAAVVVLVCCAASVLMLPLTAGLAIAPGIVAVLALTPLGLIEPLLESAAAVQQWPALRDALGRVSVLSAPPIVTAPVVAPIERVRLDEVSATWPGSSTPAVSDVTADIRRGEWLVLTGPSGSGKTTMLSVLLGHLPPSHGRYLVGGPDSTMVDASTVDRSSLRTRIAWCPQEGHLFDSTLRANLLIARDRADAPSDTELRAVLARVGLAPLLSRLPNGLDTRIGSTGADLSGGERQRVAVARTLLARSDVVLIDEPTAHLDETSSVELMSDLRDALGDRVTVLVTHEPSDLREGDQLVRLGAVRVPA
jgi:ATP-binding cassette subfamily C protein CydCD